MNKYKKSIGELAKENPTKTYKELEQMREMAITTINNRTTKTEVDMWRLTADTNTGTDGDVTTNWERVDTDGFGKIGTGLTESSGIFTFPSTGVYLITAIGNVDGDDADLNAVFELHTTEDNSSYDHASCNGFGNGSASDIRSNVSLQFMFDVTSTTTHKFKFATASFATSTALRGNTALSETCFSCTRLGDT